MARACHSTENAVRVQVTHFVGAFIYIFEFSVDIFEKRVQLVQLVQREQLVVNAWEDRFTYPPKVNG